MIPKVTHQHVLQKLSRPDIELLVMLLQECHSGSTRVEIVTHYYVSLELDECRLKLEYS